MGHGGGSAVRQYGLGVSPSRVTAEPVRVFSQRERLAPRGFPKWSICRHGAWKESFIQRKLNFTGCK